MLSNSSKILLLGTLIINTLAIATVRPISNNNLSQVKTDSVDGIFYSLHILWEGLKIKDHNLDAIKEFRNNHKNIPIIHHISPKYLENSFSKYQLEEGLKKVFKKGDKIGLYLSGWRYPIEKSEVKFRADNSFWANELDINCKNCGSEIPVTTYNYSELEKIVEYSVNAISDFGFGKPSSSFVAGWDSSDDLLRVLANNKIKIDFSMISPYIISDTIKYEQLYKQLLDTWGYQDNILAPQATVFEDNHIFQIPNNYATPGFMPYILANAQLDKLFTSINRKIYNGSTVSLMVNQDRFKRDSYHVSKFSDKLITKTKSAGLSFTFLVNSPIFESSEVINVSKLSQWKWPSQKKAVSKF